MLDEASTALASATTATVPEARSMNLVPLAPLAPSSDYETVRRAIEFIDQNAHLPITIEDIARESRLSIRALQYAFRRHLDTTPIAYLRRRSRCADPTTGATVLEIATTWGFAHPGRFATYYRETFGVSPKRTLDT